MRNPLGSMAWSLALFGAVACSSAGAGDALRRAGDAPATAADGGQSLPDGGAAPAGSSQLLVHLVDGPLDQLQEVNVDVQKVSIVAQSGAQIELAAPNAIFDLLRLQGGISALLADRTLPADRYTQVRLLLGTRNTLRLAGASEGPVALRVPSGQQSGLKINIDLDLQAGSGRDLYIDFDVAESLHLTKAGKNDRYSLRPVLRAAVKQASGSVLGRLSRSDSGAGLAGVPVFAEAVDESGPPHIVRRVLTDAEGRYRLDLLPFGRYIVVAQPTLGGEVFAAQSSPRIALSPVQTEARFDASLNLASQTGSLQLQISPPAGELEADTCVAFTDLGDAMVIVAAGTPSIADGAEQLELGPLPVGNYAVQCERRLSGDGSEPTTRVTQRIALTVNEGAATPAALGF